MKRIVLGALLIAAASTTVAGALSGRGTGPHPFSPIAGSAYNQTADLTAPFVIPSGYTQKVVSDDTDLDIYNSRCASGTTNPDSDWPDMTVSNESGRQRGRYLYRTHEVRPFLWDVACGASGLPQSAKDGFVADGGGALSVIDTKTGATKVLAQRGDWEALDGLVWTPWGTLLFAEEAIAADLPDPRVPQATSGLLYELKLNKRNPMKARSVKVRPMLGSLSHEGIEIDARGNVYVIDEDRRGSIYRFVPTRRGDLSAGQLQVLKVDAGKTGTATWVDLDMAQAQISARVAAAAVGGTEFCRPEDLERIGQTLYAALTCEDVTNPANTSGPGAIVAVTLGSTPTVHYAVAPGVNAPQENKALGITGLRAVDNLANGPDGKLWIVEDNVPADIWVADVNANHGGYAPAISLFASLKDPGAEGTGIYFGRDPHTLFVNTQHSVTGNDGTYAITNRRAGR